MIQLAHFRSDPVIVPLGGHVVPLFFSYPCGGVFYQGSFVRSKSTSGVTMRPPIYFVAQQNKIYLKNNFSGMEDVDVSYDKGPSQIFNR